MFGNKKVVIGLIILPMLYLAGQVNAADVECKYNPASIDTAAYHARLDSGEFRKFSWDNTNKIANILTREGDKVVIRHYACQALGVEAELFTSSKSQDEIKRKMLWLVGLVLKKSDVRKMEEKMGDGEFAAAFKGKAYTGKEIEGDIENAGYLNIEYIVRREDGKTALLITSYMD